MEKLTSYEELRRELIEDLNVLELLRDEPDQELLTNVAEKYQAALHLYNLVVFYFIEEGRDLDSDLSEFYSMLSDAKHPAAEVFYRATAYPKGLTKKLLASHLEQTKSDRFILKR